MKISIARSFSFLFLFCYLGCASALAKTRPAPDFGDSITWADNGESPSLANLEGKSVLVVFFQSWCGICNGWSGNLFKGVKKSYSDDSKVVVVALKTDGGSTEDAKKYLSSRVNTSGWLIGVDKNAAYYKALAQTDQLYHYAWIKPDGTIGEVEKAGLFYTKKNGSKTFTLADAKAAARFRKNAKPHFPKANSWGEEVSEAVAAAENGRFMTALKLTAKAESKGATKLKTAIGKKVDKSIASLTSKVNDATSEVRYPTFLKLSKLAENFGNSPQGKAARDAASAQERQPWMKDEKEAHEDYLSIMKRAARADDDRSRARIKKALLKLSDEFPGTYYGRLAGA